MDTELEKNRIIEDRRKFLRVAVFFPVTFTAVTPHEYEEETSAITAHPTAEREENISSLIVEEECKDLDPAVIKMWLALDKKLDRILHALEKNKEPEKDENTAKGTCTDLSITGMQLRYEDNICEGQLLKVHIQPPTFPPLALTVLGKVMRPTKGCENKTNEYGISFTEVNEDDKERLVRYIFKRQREIIRAGQ